MEFVFGFRRSNDIFKLKYFDWILKSTYGNNVAEDLPLNSFTEVVTLRILADAKRAQDGFLMYFVDNTSLAWELKDVSQLILENLEYNTAVYSNSVGRKYWGFE